MHVYLENYWKNEYEIIFHVVENLKDDFYGIFNWKLTDSIAGLIYILRTIFILRIVE